VLDRLRGRLQGYLERLGSAFSRVVGSPTAWTFVGLGASALAAGAFASRWYGGALPGGVLILVAGFFDIVDGAVAKATRRASRRGAFLDSNLDRVAEAAIYAGILVGGFAAPLWVLVALSASLLVSYARAKGDSLGVTLSGVGIGERSERLLILAVASVVGFTQWGVLLVAVVASYTFVERTARAVSALK
jgi:archaetidylinositol phosphate synthase